MQDFRYRAPQIAIHWLAAAVVLFLLATGMLVLAELPNNAQKVGNLRIHMILGGLAALLVVARIALRRRLPPPPPVQGETLGWLGHLALNLVVLLLAFSGALLVLQSGALDAVLGNGVLPEDFKQFLPRKIHGLAARAAIGLGRPACPGGALPPAHRQGPPAVPHGAGLWQGRAIAMKPRLTRRHGLLLLGGLAALGLGLVLLRASPLAAGGAGGHRRCRARHAAGFAVRHRRRRIAAQHPDRADQRGAGGARACRAGRSGQGRPVAGGNGPGRSAPAPARQPPCAGACRGGGRCRRGAGARIGKPPGHGRGQRQALCLAAAAGFRQHRGRARQGP
jgi:cytochrome b561